jgi:hypothetical protein
MLTKLAVKTTDPIRRQALGLAIQLPDNVVEARAVLDQTRLVFEEYMIGSSREIGNGPVSPAAPDPSVGVVSHECAATWTIGLLLLLAPLAALAAHLFDCETASGWVLLAGVAVAALVFGPLYGVGFSIGGAFAHNLLAVPPVFEFQAPSRCEVIRLIGCLALAIILPLTATAAHRLRAMAFTAGRASRAPESP